MRSIKKKDKPNRWLLASLKRVRDTLSFPKAHRLFQKRGQKGCVSLKQCFLDTLGRCTCRLTGTVTVCTRTAQDQSKEITPLAIDDYRRGQVSCLQ